MATNYTAETTAVLRALSAQWRGQHEVLLADFETGKWDHDDAALRDVHRQLRDYQQRADAIEAALARIAEQDAALAEAGKCGSCGEPLSRDCPRCAHLWQT